MKSKENFKYETKFVKYLTDAEFQLILKELDNRSYPLRMFLKTLAYLGLRVSDAISLKRENFNKDFSNIIYLLFWS